MVLYINCAKDQVFNLFDVIINPSYKELDYKLSQVESLLNCAGYVPIISMVSGRVREGLGWVEIITGVVLGALKKIAATFAKSDEAKKRLYHQSEKDFSYVIHGLGNVTRGKVEQYGSWGLLLLIINKLMLLIYDSVQFRLNYESEKTSSKHPLLGYNKIVD